MHHSNIINLKKKHKLRNVEVMRKQLAAHRAQISLEIITYYMYLKIIRIFYTSSS